MMHKWHFLGTGFLLVWSLFLVWSNLRGVEGIQALKQQQLRLRRNAAQLEQRIAEIEQRLIRVQPAAGPASGRSVAFGMHRLADVAAHPAKSRSRAVRTDEDRRLGETVKGKPEEEGD